MLDFSERSNADLVQQQEAKKISKMKKSHHCRNERCGHVWDVTRWEEPCPKCGFITYCVPPTPEDLGVPKVKQDNNPQVE